MKHWDGRCRRNGQTAIKQTASLISTFPSLKATVHKILYKYCFYTFRMDMYDVELWKRDPRDFQLESVGLRMSPSCSILRSPTEVLGAHVYHGQTSVQASVQESEESRHVPESDH